MSELRGYYVLIEPWAIYVKDAEFFVAQRGLVEEWAKRWELVKAESIEHARFLGASKRNAAAPSPQDPRDEALRVAREALEFYAELPCYEHNLAAREAIHKIKELMGEK